MLDFKKFILIFLYFLIGCSSLEQKGYKKPTLQKSTNMEIISNTFIYDFRLNKKLDMRYNLIIKFINLEKIVGKYIIVEFQDPQNINKFFKKTYLINKDDKILNIKSDKIYNCQNKEVYLVKIYLSEDKNGDKILETIEQRTRVDYIPFTYKNVL